MRSARPWRSTLMRATASASLERSAPVTRISGQAMAASTARLPLPVHRSSTSWVASLSQGSMPPSAISSALKLRGQAAVAGAQVEPRMGGRAEPGAGAAAGDQLGNEAARRDRGPVDVTGHALQPGLAGEVGGGVARGDAAFDERAHGLGLGVADG